MDVLQVTQTRPACHVHVMPRQFHSKFQDLGSVLKPIAVKGKEQLHLGGRRVSKAPWWCFREAGAVLARWLMWSEQPAAACSPGLPFLDFSVGVASVKALVLGGSREHPSVRELVSLPPCSLLGSRGPTALPSSGQLASPTQGMEESVVRTAVPHPCLFQAWQGRRFLQFLAPGSFLLSSLPLPSSHLCR